MIALKPSVQLAIALSGVHIVAAALLWLADIPVAGKAVVTLPLAVSLVFFMARHATLHAAGAIVALELGDAGTIAIRRRHGEWQDCVLLDSTFVSPPLTIVNLRPRGRGGSRRIILVPDNVNAGDFRRLRAWLRWQSGARKGTVPHGNP